MCGYGEYLCFGVKVGSVGVECASSYCAQGYVLAGLEFRDIGIG